VVYGVFGKTSDGELPVGFYPCTEEFIGEGGSFENPKAISDGNIATVKEGLKIEGYEALGGIQFQNITLEPMEEKIDKLPKEMFQILGEIILFIENTNKFEGDKNHENQ